jgi:hypothetical protein
MRHRAASEEACAALLLRFFTSHVIDSPASNHKAAEKATDEAMTIAAEIIGFNTSGLDFRARFFVSALNGAWRRLRL